MTYITFDAEAPPPFVVLSVVSVESARQRLPFGVAPLLPLLLRSFRWLPVAQEYNTCQPGNT